MTVVILILTLELLLSGHVRQHNAVIRKGQAAGRGGTVALGRPSEPLETKYGKFWGFHADLVKLPKWVTAFQKTPMTSFLEPVAVTFYRK